MKLIRNLSLFSVILLVGWGPSVRSDEIKDEVKETALEAPNHVKLRLRMEGPYTADVSLQVVYYFKYTPERAQRMSGAPVELDKRLGGVIASLREGGEFPGERLETLLVTPPDDAIKAKALLLIGLGEEDALTPMLMEAVGRLALREAARLGATSVGFAPLIRDQGNKKLSAGDVAAAVVRGMLLAQDTNQRLYAQGLGKSFTLDEWWMEARPAYFDETVAGVTKATEEAVGFHQGTRVKSVPVGIAVKERNAQREQLANQRRRSLRWRRRRQGSSARRSHRRHIDNFPRDSARALGNMHALGPRDAAALRMDSAAAGPEWT